MKQRDEVGLVEIHLALHDTFNWNHLLRIGRVNV